MNTMTKTFSKSPVCYHCVLKALKKRAWAENKSLMTIEDPQGAFGLPDAVNVYIVGKCRKKSEFRGIKEKMKMKYFVAWCPNTLKTCE